AKTASASACVMRVGVSVRLLHESEDRPQLAVNGSGGEVLDQAIYRFRRDAEQLRRRAVASVAVLARVEGRHVCADQLPLGWRKRRRATQDRLGNADPMRVDLGMGGKNVLGCRIFGQRGKERHFAPPQLAAAALNAAALLVDVPPWSSLGPCAAPRRN